MNAAMQILLNAFTFLLLLSLTLFAEMPRKETREQPKYDLNYRLVLLRVTHKPSLWKAANIGMGGNQAGFYHLLIKGKLYSSLSGVPTKADKEPDQEQTFIFAFLLPQDLFHGVGDVPIEASLAFAVGSYVCWEKSVVVGSDTLESVTVDGAELVNTMRQNQAKLELLLRKKQVDALKKE